MDTFQSTVIMAPYLLAFVVGEFDCTMNAEESNFKIWHEPSMKEQAKFAASIAPSALHFYEDYFKVDYPLPKMDMVAVPGLSGGAMENWGLITYGYSALLFDEENSGAKSKQTIVSVMAHEVSHQWFGNLVTMNWWNNLWLNEGE